MKEKKWQKETGITWYYQSFLSYELLLIGSFLPGDNKSSDRSSYQRKVDPLIGMKENVIIGKLIPAGTGMKRYRNIKLDSDVNENDEIDFDDDSFADEEFAPVEE